MTTFYPMTKAKRRVARKISRGVQKERTGINIDVGIARDFGDGVELQSRRVLIGRRRRRVLLQVLVDQSLLLHQLLGAILLFRRPAHARACAQIHIPFRSEFDNGYRYNLVMYTKKTAILTCKRAQNSPVTSPRNHSYKSDNSPVEER